MRAFEPLKPGRVYCFTSGEYSDFGIVGHFIAVRELSVEELTAASAEAWRRAAEAKPPEVPFTPGQTTPWGAGGTYYNVSWQAERLILPELIKLGALVEIDVEEIHIFDVVRIGQPAA